ncbi:UBA domain-containing protein/Rhomboid domain-containing protein [Cephalotus follicularis]|uniref:UBA domain-containing protein/Rhomboid domain-containing protein n=1 Tax=Cephalotus follicularis TaxID=3775 RepID=A0A1Q3D110_CEPFO|nr:UBA domain-containing protein/Rhomboid domain-containing protein [Cephalotus follicularis]
MRPNVVTEAGLPTRLGQWWEGIPFLTSVIVIVCGIIYLVCLLVGYDSFYEICFLPSAVIPHFQVYRFYTAVIFHGSLLHVLFNMLALVPLGSELERITGSVRLLYLIVLLATSNAIFHLLFAFLVAYNPIHPYQYFMNECAIGFSGILFSMIVIETSLSGVEYRSVFGLFNVPSMWYAWILLVLFQLLMPNVSLLGHLCGIISGFAYTYGLFNLLMPGTSFYSAIEGFSWLSSCVRRPKFILCTGGNPSGHIPTYSGQNRTSSGLFSGNVWRNLSSWMPHRETSAQSTEDSIRFPGRGRTVASGPVSNADSNLQARLLDNNIPNYPADRTVIGTGEQLSHVRQSAVNNAVASAGGNNAGHQGSVASDEGIQKLVAMGFERTQVEVALAAADGDLNVAVEILSQQG